MAENVSRRNIFHILGAAVPAAALAGAAAQNLEAQHQHSVDAADSAGKNKGPYQRQTFDDHQWQTVRVLSDLIVPADESGPSATVAGVPEFLDDWIAFRTGEDGSQDFRGEMLGGLMWLDHEANKMCSKDFVDAGTESQKRLLDRIAYPAKVARDDHQGMRFFSQFRTLVVSGYFSSKAGVAALPYLGNVAVMEWKGCDPKVWAIIEDRIKNGYTGGVVEAKPLSFAS